MRPHKSLTNWCAWLPLLGLAGSAQAQLVAMDDDYIAPAGGLLEADPGVLENDRLDGEDLPPSAIAERLSNVSHGTLQCGSEPAPSLCADGLFTYTSASGFVGTDSFTYRTVVGETNSNVATVTLTVSGCDGGPTLFRCWVEASYLERLAELGHGTLQEGFEDDTIWGSVRYPDTAPSVQSQGLTWSSNDPAFAITTSSGPARTGDWGMYSYPHGDTDPVGDPTDPQRDGFVGTTAGSLFGVGGWLTSNTGGARVRLVLDGTVAIDFNDPGVVSQHKFFGAIDTTGFKGFEFYETEGTRGDQEFIFADDFTVGAEGTSLIFGDGFESGDLSAWSVAEP